MTLSLCIVHYGLSAFRRTLRACITTVQPVYEKWRTMKRLHGFTLRGALSASVFFAKMCARARARQRSRNDRRNFAAARPWRACHFSERRRHPSSSFNALVLPYGRDALQHLDSARSPAVKWTRVLFNARVEGSRSFRPN